MESELPYWPLRLYWGLQENCEGDVTEKVDRENAPYKSRANT